MRELIRDKILGLIPNNWVVKKFDEVVDIIHGYQFRTNDFTKSGVKVFKITQIKGDGVIDISNCDYIATERLDNFNKNKLAYNDILMALTGATIGKIARFKSDEICLQNYRVGKFISKDKNVVSEDYLYYFLSSKLFFHQLLARQTQSAQQNIGKEDINQMTICFPDLPTQITIAEILSCLDDKIELNNKINHELENLAQTLFKRWFIDFEFPNENGEPYKSNGGEMEDSELGEIPKGWDVFQIGDVCDLISGYPFKGDSFVKSGNYGIVTIKNVQDGKFIQETDNYIDELPSKFPKSTMLKIGDILMSLTGNVGRLCYVTKENCLLNQRVVKIKGIQKDSNALWYYYFRQNVIKDILISISKGTAQLNLSPVETKSLKLKFPKIIDENILVVFNEIFNNQVSCSNENNELTKLRDTLLPKLISGELELIETLNKWQSSPKTI
jgi:type I restriction enzyme S subunit